MAIQERVFSHRRFSSWKTRGKATIPYTQVPRNRNPAVWISEAGGHRDCRASKVRAMAVTATRLGAVARAISASVVPMIRRIHQW